MAIVVLAEAVVFGEEVCRGEAASPPWLLSLEVEASEVDDELAAV